ncbi:Adenylate cyclase [Candidatus Nitrotoga fabula]|uniref:Adenylate cyclase n=1 Tax=Candidatus Nitrotoga fabula TaxID=2182327 RepID=A0A916BDG6_9PROT|nr:Adenylate cyclase [Candidatus Nitrotoga fabula]
MTAFVATEIELKLTIDPAHVTRLRNHPMLKTAGQEKSRRRKLYSVYFDTPDRDLYQSGIALRLRRTGRCWMQTVKGGGSSEGGMHQRQEWEWPVQGMEPELIPDAAHAPANLLTPDILVRLRPLFITDFWRTVWKLRTINGDEVELALDQGAVFSGEKSFPISEVELELKVGAASSLFEVALAIQEHVFLRVEDVSKAERGYRLHGGELPLPRMSREVELVSEMSAEQAFRCIVRECIGQLQGNVAEIGRIHNPEYLHQAHVATRRLHMILGWLAVRLPDATDNVMEELRWLMGCLGKARDWDVFISQTLPQIANEMSDNQTLQRLRENAVGLCHAQYQEVVGAVLSQRYTRLVLKLGLIAVRQADQDGKRAAILERLAGQILSRQYKCLRRKGRKYAAMSPAEYHSLRIAAKKLRYAVEFFACLYPRKRARHFLSVLAALQDSLGELNDAVVTQRLLGELHVTRGYGAGIVYGWTVCSARCGLQKMHLVWSELMRRKPFWQ